MRIEYMQHEYMQFEHEFEHMMCNCYNKGTCKACLNYKTIVDIINITDLNVTDPATFIRTKINSKFEITTEECDILERVKYTNDYTEYKEYLLKPTHYIQCDNRSIVHIKCPKCENNINITITTAPYICCTEFFTIIPMMHGV